MQESAFRYQPEFRIRILVNGQDAGDTVQVVPAPATSVTMSNYGLLTKSVPGGLLGFGRQHPDDNTWAPAVDFDQPRVFSFWFIAPQGAGTALDFFGEGTRRLGRQIFYTNNLAVNGAIDSNLNNGVVSLTAGNEADDAERGVLSPYLLSVAVTPGDFTLVQAGKIQAGAPVGFSISEPITPNQSSVTLNFGLRPKGAYVVRLQGPSPVEERVVFDEEAVRTGVQGVIDIYKDAWHGTPAPREYRVNFLSTP